jgi:hypothetical protein
MTYLDAKARPPLDTLDLHFAAFETPPTLAQSLLDTDPTGAQACDVTGPGTIPPPDSVTPG